MFAFEDWKIIYNRPGTGGALDEFRTQQKRTWYLMRFLRDAGVRVIPVAVTASDLLDWAGDTDHELTDSHSRAHAVGDFVNQAGRPTNCAHTYPEISLGAGEALATLTVYGESEDIPEIMGVAIHLADGQVITALEIMAIRHTPEDAWGLAQDFIRRHRPARVFHDQTVRRPEYCADCGALLMSVAAREDIERAL